MVINDTYHYYLNLNTQDMCPIYSRLMIVDKHSRTSDSVVSINLCRIFEENLEESKGSLKSQFKWCLTYCLRSIVTALTSNDAVTCCNTATLNAIILRQ